MTVVQTNQALSTHVLLRFSDSLHGVGDPIAEHKAVATAYHEVWFGKFGRGMAPWRIAELNEQIARGIETHLYLVHRGHDKYKLYRAKAIEFAPTVPPTERRIPGYYRAKDLLRQVGVWVRIHDIESVPAATLDSLIVSSSRRPARESLRGSTAGMFFVAER
jgi:hypothetical protein